MSLLELRNLSKYFGGLAAVHQLNMKVNSGEIVGLIGPNGAGKTTTFNLITGDYSPSSGNVFFDGKDISGRSPHLTAKMGIVRTFQLTALFPHLSVLENVLIGLHLHSTIGFFEALFNTRSNRRKERELNRQAEKIMEFMDLVPMKGELAKNLPHGRQRAIGIAIALAASPKLLLLDEPLTGMNLQESRTMISTILDVRDKTETTIVIVEHNMKAVMALCERLVVINFGRKIGEGPPEEIRKNKKVIEAYLGSENDASHD